MDQEEPSFTSAPDAFHPNALRQNGSTAGEAIPNLSRSIGPPKKRAPLASVACQDCRRRKTKCDSKKPSYGNCSKRGIPACTYDLEPNQSRVAAYKQKIEQQISAIKALEEEIDRLKKAALRPETVVQNPISETTHSSSNPSGGVPMRLLLNPAPEPIGLPPGQTSHSHGLPVHDSTPLPSVRMASRETALLDYQRNLAFEKRKLEDENHKLRTLIFLLNSVDDRNVAQQMAKEIYNTHGISDDLLSRAQHLVASQVWRPSLPDLQNQAKAQPQRPPGRVAENSRSMP